MAIGYDTDEISSNAGSFITTNEDWVFSRSQPPLFCCILWVSNFRFKSISIHMFHLAILSSWFMLKHTFYWMTESSIGWSWSSGREIAETKIEPEIELFRSSSSIPRLIINASGASSSCDLLTMSGLLCFFSAGSEDRLGGMVLTDFWRVVLSCIDVDVCGARLLESVRRYRRNVPDLAVLRGSCFRKNRDRMR